MQISQFPQRRTKNLLINASFRVNQRAYVSAAATAAANQYTLDRWRVLLSGESVTFPAIGADNTLTVPAGGLGQKIEDINIKGGVYTVQWSGSASCKVNGTARSVGESFFIASDTEVDIVFYSGTLNKPQIEEGSIVTEFEYRSIGEELFLAKRFYQRLMREVMGFVRNATTVDFWCALPVELRGVPSLELHNTSPYSESPWYAVVVTPAGVAVLSGGAHVEKTSVGFQVSGYTSLVAGDTCLISGENLSVDAEL